MEEKDAAERALMVRAPASLTASRMPVQELLGQVAVIQEVMQTVMQKDVHYGKIPNTPKPTLYKPGAELLNLTFRLDAEYESHESWDGDHLTVKSRCTLYHIPSGDRLGSGEGMCSTKESKYAYRKGERKCPKCGGGPIIKGKEEYGGGWVCWKSRGGCGSKFGDGDKSIESQNPDRIPNPDLADQYNTILKMANKRSLVAATLNVTAASDMFTQDLEDIARHQAPEPEPPKPQRKATRKSAKGSPERSPVVSDNIDQPAYDIDPKEDVRLSQVRLSPKERAAVEASPPSEGFGDEDPDRKITEDEWKELLLPACYKRATEIGVDGSAVRDFLLAEFEVERPGHLTLSQLRDALPMVRHLKREDLG